MKTILTSFCLMLITAGYATAQTEMPLYPDGKIPNAIKTNTLQEGSRDIGHGNRFIYNITIPTITPYLSAHPAPTKPAIIILPGGGYAGVSIDGEGRKVAMALNEMGIAAFVVKYRMPSSQSMIDKRIGALQDAQEAISMVRKNSSKWNIDPMKVGIMGFSAGGNLAANLSTRYRVNLLNPTDNTTNLRPDFSILVYPVISMTDSLTHAGSRTNLLGNNPSAEDIRLNSAELQVDQQTPPTLLIHAGDDPNVNPENSIHYYQALRKNKVSAELIIYPHGGHGYGLDNTTTTDQWIARCHDWMLANKWLTE